MSILSILALMFIAQTAPQEEKKPVPEAPVEEKKPPQDPVPPPRDPEEGEPWPVDFQADVRTGGWRTGTFNAMTAAGQRKIESTLLFDAGLDVRAIYSGWTLAVTADYASGKSMTLTTGGILVGMDFELAPQLELQVAVGPILGRFDVDVAGFGNFQTAAGFEVRFGATGWVHERIGISLWFDYREISFKYDEPVVSGDKSAGGAGFALGAGLVMRF